MSAEPDGWAWRNRNPLARRKRVRRGALGERIASLFPQPFEPPSRHPGVNDRVTRISVAEVVLHGPQIRASVGQVEAAGVAERVRVYVLSDRFPLQNPRDRGMAHAIVLGHLA
jgi:hypothetical protein